jgi:poly-gamma-glutamate capsule biosynthesis protein CapA/YwtB (metallophosphatase superfamily)
MPILDYNNCSDIVLNVKNKKIAFLGISLVYNDITEIDILNRITKLKENNDVVIVNIHFGNEYQEQSNNRQKALARKMVDSGVDIVIGHHPHVIQDYEIYKEKPIFYSLGNFIFDQYFSAETQEGLVIKIVLSEEEEKIKITNEVYKIKTKGSKIEEISKMP